MGRTPGSAADAPVGLNGNGEICLLGEERVQGDPRGPGGSAPQRKLLSVYWLPLRGGALVKSTSLALKTMERSSTISTVEPLAITASGPREART